MQSSLVPEGLWEKKDAQKGAVSPALRGSFQVWDIFFEDIFLGAAGICI